MPIHIQLNGQDPTRIYKIYPNDPYSGKFLGRPKKGGKNTLLVSPCQDHENGITVPVEVVIWDHQKEERKYLGKAKACPLCWQILKIVDGSALKKLLGE